MKRCRHDRAFHYRFGLVIGLLVALLVVADWGMMGGFRPPYGPYMMDRYGYGPGMMYGYGPWPEGTPYGASYGNIEGPAGWYGNQAGLNLSTDDVQNYFE